MSKDELGQHANDKV